MGSGNQSESSAAAGTKGYSRRNRKMEKETKRIARLEIHSLKCEKILVYFSDCDRTDSAGNWCEE